MVPATPVEITETIVSSEPEIELPPKEIVDIDEPLSEINPISLEDYEIEKVIEEARIHAMVEEGESSEYSVETSDGTSSENCDSDGCQNEDEFLERKAAWR